MKLQKHEIKERIKKTNIIIIIKIKLHKHNLLFAKE